MRRYRQLSITESALVSASTSHCDSKWLQTEFFSNPRVEKSQWCCALAKLDARAMIVIVCILGFTVLVQGEPSFLETKSRITVTAGQTAVLPCVLDSLDGYQVVWTDQWSTLLTYMSWTILDDPRLEVSSSGSEMSLVLHDASPQDSGDYFCQVNTDPVKTHKVHLDVVAP